MLTPRYAGPGPGREPVGLDTNALVCATLLGGMSSKLVSLRQGLITLLLFREIVDEYFHPIGGIFGNLGSAGFM